MAMMRKKMPLLSLLRALRTSVTISAEQHSNDLTHDTHTTTTTTTTTSSSSSSSSLLLQRIDMATQYVLQFFSPFDLESILQSSIHSDMHDDDGLVFAANALPSLQSKDFAEVDLARINKSMTSDGRILGPLIQSPQPPTATTATSAPMTATAVRWLCSDHTQACCEAQIREKMKAAIALNGGSSMEHERLAEIQFKSRERAKEFYALLREFKCVAKLHIHLAWRGLTDEDLWELGEVIHKAGITELALDCACVAEDDHQQPKHPQQQQQQPLNFKPVLGMLFLPRLMSFTINNFSATLPALNAFNFGTYANDTFSLQDFRDSPALTLPASNSLSTLAFNNCGPGTQAQQMTELLRHSPLLTDVRLECDRIDSALAKIEEATNQMDKITFVKLSESAWESAEMTYGRDYSDGNSSSAGDMENRQPSTLKCLNRKTQRLLNIHLQDLGVLERLTTCTYLELWDKHQTTLATLIAQNPRLHTLELMCEVQSMDRLWRFLISHYQHHQQIQQLKQEEHEMSQMDLLDLPQANPYQQQPPPPTYFSHHSPSAASSSKFLHLHLYDKSCSLMVYTPVFNVFVLNDYTDAQRQLMHSLEDITTAICIGSGFHDPEQLALLRMHLEEDGAFKFKSLTWVLTPKLQNDPYFLEQLRALVTSQCAITHFTIRVYAPLFDIRSLVRAWNWIVDAAWLSEEEHGRWIQTCLEHEKEEGGRSGADSLSTTAPNAGGTGDGGEESLNAARTAALSKRATAQTMHLPGHGTMQSYTLPLDEHNQLILASSHFYFPSAFASSIKGAQTAATYSLTLDRTEDGHGLLV
ncbi:hypothetical protein EDD11_008524 [Mortierella claussenii]|nr:hypothetical protein EDD11_008524 [Mortierella claussenii]